MYQLFEVNRKTRTKYPVSPIFRTTHGIERFKQTFPVTENYYYEIQVIREFDPNIDEIVDSENGE